MAEFKNIKFKEEKGKQNMFIQTNKKRVEFQHLLYVHK